MKELQKYDTEYTNWLIELKSTIRSAQLKAAIAVNSSLIEFYWELGRMISEKQSATKWGDKVIDQLSHDLKKEFPDMKGLSRRNLFNAKQFYLFYQDTIVQHPVAQIPWGHNILIFSKSNTIEEAKFYIRQTIGYQRVLIIFKGRYIKWKTINL